MLRLSVRGRIDPTDRPVVLFVVDGLTELLVARVGEPESNDEEREDDDLANGAPDGFAAVLGGGALPDQLLANERIHDGFGSGVGQEASVVIG